MTCFPDKENKEVKVSNPSLLNRMVLKIGAVVFVAMAMVSAASASIATDLDNFTLIIGNTTSGLTGFTVNMMGVFMTPPLLYFVVMGIFISIVGIVAGLLMRRGRRR